MNKTTTPADAAAWADAQVRRHTSWPLDILGAGPHCTGTCRQGRALCVSPEACGVQKPVLLAPAEELQAEPQRKATPQEVGNAAGNIVGGVILLLLFIGGLSWLLSGSATTFFTWAGSSLASLLR